MQNIADRPPTNKKGTRKFFVGLAKTSCEPHPFYPKGTANLFFPRATEKPSPLSGVFNVLSICAPFKVGNPVIKPIKIFMINTGTPSFVFYI